MFVLLNSFIFISCQLHKIFEKNSCLVFIEFLCFASKLFQCYIPQIKEYLVVRKRNRENNTKRNHENERVKHASTDSNSKRIPVTLTRHCNLFAVLRLWKEMNLKGAMSKLYQDQRCQTLPSTRNFYKQLNCKYHCHVILSMPKTDQFSWIIKLK